MSKLNFTYRRPIVALALVTTLFWQSLLPAAGGRSLTHAAALAGLDLSKEAQVLAIYFSDLVAYYQQCALLNKQPSVSRTEFDQVERQSNELLGRLPDVQFALREIINKLKAANEWDNLDAYLLAKTTDPRAKTFLEQGSAKRDLEDAYANVGAQADEISAPLNALRQKLTARTFSPNHGLALVPAAYRAPAPSVFANLICLIGRVLIDVTLALGGTVSDRAWDVVSCVCGATRGIGTMTPCNEVLAIY